MYAPVLLAQLSGSSPQASGSPAAPPKNLKIEKPGTGQAVTVHLDGQTKLDFSDIASEKLTFVRVGDKLVVLFDNQSTVTVEPVFDSSGHPLADIAFAMGADRILTGEQFAELFPITTDQSVLPAGGNGPTGGAFFGDPHVDPLSTYSPLALLGAETFGSSFIPLTNEVPNPTSTVGAAGVAGGNPGGTGDVPTPIAGAVDVASINEDGLAGGNAGGTGDVPGALSVTGSLHVNFGTDAVGRSFAFAAVQPTLTALTSDGQAVHLFVTTVGGLPTMIGYVGNDPGVVANQVFTVSLDANSTIEGAYTFTLLRPLDHPILGTEDTLHLLVNVIATDGSGDTAPTVIHVNVNDDTPVIVAANETHSTLTDPLPFAVSTQSGLLGVSWGADRFNDHVDGGVSATNGHTGDRSVVFTDNVVTLTGHVQGGDAGQTVAFATLTSGGDEVHFALLSNGTVLMAYTGDVNVVPGLPATGGDSGVSGDIVFIATLSDASDTGSYVITQYQPLDHNSGEQTFSSIDLSFHFTATDSDGDPVSGTLTTTVADTVPTVGTIPVGDVSEDGPLSLIAAPLTIDWGADNNNGADRSLAFTDNVVTVTDPAGHAVALKSYGDLVHVGFFDGVLVGYTGCLPESLTDSNVVFAAVLSDVTGSYDFVLVQPLNHGAPVGTSDYLDLAFHITATDSDGDHATGSFTVRVDAAGSIGSTGSIDYDNETTGVFVNLDSHKHTYGCQTVAAGRSTDIDGQGPVVGIDKVAGITNARGGSGDDILVGSSGISNTLDGGAGQDLLVVLPDLVVPAGSRTFDRGDGTSEQIDVTGLAGGSDNIHGGSGYDTVRFDLDGVTDKGFLFDGASFPGSLAIDGVERFIGTYGNDVIILPTDYTADDGDVTVKGGKGDDVISGSNNADSLFGGNGDDRISGLGGDDTIRGNRGDDVIWGDAGNDTISGGLGDDTLLGGGGNDHFIYKVGDGHDIIDGGAGNSDRLNVNGNNHNQVFALTATGETGFQIETDGGGTPEIIAIKVEKVVLNVAGGHDSITITDIGSDDTITVTGTTGDFTVDGTNLPEIRVLNTGSLDLDLAGRNGNDTIDASALDSAGSPQTLHVTLDGGAGNDTIAGSNGADTLNGGAGNDILRGGAGNDAIDGGTGMDIIDFSDGTAGIDVALVQSPGNTTVNLTAAGLGTDTYKNIEGIFGTAFADTLHGTALNDYFNGGGGKDTLIGGGGSDTLIGGAGSDTFKWLAGDVAGGSLDTILDFETGAAGDILDLSGVLSGVSGNKADHVRVLYTADNFTQLASAAGAPHAVNGDIRIQVNLSGSAWTDVATIHDTGPNLTPGNEVIKMMLDNSTQQVHV